MLCILDIRLLGGDTPNIGVVEINGPDGWGTICTDDGSWNTESARVVCKQLGFADVVMAQEANVGHYGYSMGPNYITKVECNGGLFFTFFCTTCAKVQTLVFSLFENTL